MGAGITVRIATTYKICQAKRGLNVIDIGVCLVTVKSVVGAILGVLPEQNAKV